jgi:mRNA interferase MazF
MEIRRGHICLVDFGQSFGSVQNGQRPAVIIQNDKGNEYAPTTLACPLTSKIKRHNFPTHVLIPAKETGIKVDSVVLCEQLRVIDKLQIISVIGRLTNSLLSEIDKTLLISLGINIK